MTHTEHPAADAASRARPPAPGPIPTWAVVATAREPFPLLAAFAAHHLRIGAAEVFLYLDRPSPRTVRRLSAVAGVRVTVADEAYFTATHGCPRPEANMRRQRLNALDAYRRTGADWLLHADADEFLRPGALVQELAALPPEVMALRVPNGERAFLDTPRTIFDGVLRRMPDSPKRHAHLFGAVACDFTRSGFSGHAAGKSLTRTGQGLRIGIHAPLQRHEAAIATSSSAVICHFDGLTPLHWARKLRAYVGTGIYDTAATADVHRHRQMTFVAEARDRPERIVALHREIKHIPDGALPAFVATGLAEPLGLDIEGAVAATFGRGAPDLSVENFDRLLLRDAGLEAAHLLRLAREMAAPEVSDAAIENVIAPGLARTG